MERTGIEPVTSGLQIPGSEARLGQIRSVKAKLRRLRELKLAIRGHASAAFTSLVRRRVDGALLRGADVRQSRNDTTAPQREPLIVKLIGRAAAADLSISHASVPFRDRGVLAQASGS